MIHPTAASVVISSLFSRITRPSFYRIAPFALYSTTTESSAFMTTQTITSAQSITTRDWQDLLSDQTFDIEFNGYLSNHAKHAIVALHRIQAPKERVQGYWNEYTGTTPYGINLHPATPWDQITPVTKQEFKNLRGTKENWQGQCMFLQNELEGAFGGDVDKLVQYYAPSLLRGMAGALTHGIIHLGWGIDAKNTWMTIEGLAYLNFASVGLPEDSLTSNAVSEAAPLDSIKRIAARFHNENLKDNWIEATKALYDKDSGFHSELIPAGFQWELSKVLAHPHEVATMLPSWLDEHDLATIWEELFRLTTTLYWATRDAEGNGNFLVLHLVTSLWGLEHTLKVIANETVSRAALKHYFATLVCLIATSAGGFPTVKDLENAVEDIGSVSDDMEQEESLWRETVEKAYPEQEEHNIKLVYVMRELWWRYNGWSGFRKAADAFTLTPNIGPSASEFKA